MLKNTNKYTSHDMQNDMLKAMAHKVLRNINSQLHNASFFTIMADETTDASNEEQVVIIFRYVDNNDFSVEEEFLNQASTGHRPARAWLLKIDPVWIVSMHACVSVCVCVSIRGY